MLRHNLCQCNASPDYLYCDNCGHRFCGLCQVVFRQIFHPEVVIPPLKACPKCFSTELAVNISTN